MLFENFPKHSFLSSLKATVNQHISQLKASAELFEMLVNTKAHKRANYSISLYRPLSNRF